jgi:hypothetical protein
VWYTETGTYVYLGFTIKSAIVSHRVQGQKTDNCLPFSLKLALCMKLRVAARAEGYKVSLNVGSAPTAKTYVVHLEVLHTPAVLAAPSVSLQYSATELIVVAYVQAIMFHSAASLDTSRARPCVRVVGTAQAGKLISVVSLDSHHLDWPRRGNLRRSSPGNIRETGRSPT